MTSLLSVLSLLILVLANGYFAVPIGDERSSTPLSHVNLTTDHGVQLQFISDNETSTLSILEYTQPIGQSTEETVTTSTNSQLEEQVSHASRLFDILANETTTVELTTSTDLPFTTLESSTQGMVHGQRDTEDESESKREHHETDESDNQLESDADKRETLDESTTTSTSSFTLTSSAVAPHLYTTDSSSTTTTTFTSQPDTTESPKQYTGLLEGDEEKNERKPTKPLKKQSKVKSEDEIEGESQTKSEDETRESRRKPKVKSEEESQRKSKVKSEDEIEGESQTKSEDGTSESRRKPKVKSEDKSEEESQKKSKVKSDDESDENIKRKQSKKTKYEDDDDSKDSTAPMAQFDQKALDNIPSISNGAMVLDESNANPVIPEKLVKIKSEQKEKPKQLNQGEKSAHSEEKESDQ